MTKFLYRFWPVFVIAGIIFYLSSLPGQVINSNGLGNEALHINGHFIMYFLLFFAWYRGTKSLRSALFLTFVYSLTDEFHQSFVPGRSSGVFDIYVDLAGSLLGFLIIWKFYSHLPKTLKNWLKQ